MILKRTIISSERNVLYAIIVLVLMQLFITLLTNGFAMSQDEAMWHYIGRNWFRHGMVPYSGGVDNKSPLVFAVFGVSDWLFGVNYWFPRVFGVLCQTIGIYYLYKIARHIAGQQAGLLAISFYGLSMLWHGADGRYASFTETYEVMFIILSFYIFLTAQHSRSFFISGFLAVIGLGFRLSAFFGIATLVIMSFRKGRACTLMYSLGVISGIVFLCAIAVLAGINLHDVFVYSLADNFGAGSTTDHGFLWRAVQFYNLFFYSEMILFYPLVMVYFFIKKKIDWVALWMILEFIGINILGNYARVDLKDLLPAISLVSAFAITYLVEQYHISLNKLMLIIWVCFSTRLLEPFVNFARIFTGEFQKAENYCHEPFIPPDESASRQLGWWVKANTAPNEKVLVAGYGSQVQVYSERISPTIFFNATQTRIAKERFYRDMEHDKPAMILVPLFAEYKQYIDADLRSYIDTLVVHKYYSVTCMFNYNVFRIRK